MMAYLRGPVAKLIFGALLVAFLAFIAIDFGANGRFGGAGHAGMVAQVGRTGIPQPEFDVLYNQELDSTWAPVRDVLTDGDELEIRKRVVDRLVDQTLAWEGAARMGLGYTPEDVQNAIRSMPVFMNQQGQFDPARYQAALARLGLPQAYFEDDQMRAMSASRVENAVRDSVRVTDLELWLEYLRWHRKMKVAVLDFPLAAAKAKERVTDEDVRAYWDNDVAQFKQTGRSEYHQPERVHLRHIVVAASQAAGPEALAQAKAKMDTVLAQLKAGTPFADVARKMSDDGNTAMRGGDLGWRVKGELIPEYDKVVFKLKAGERSQVFQTQFGYHLILCEAHKPAENPTFDDVKGKIRAEIAAGRAGAKLLAQATRADWAALKAKNLADGASVGAVPVRELGWVQLGSARPAGFSATDFEDLVEALSGCEPGDVTKVVSTPDGYLIAQLKDEQDIRADERGFIKERAIIEPVLLARKQQAAWDAWLAAARAKTRISIYQETGG